MICRRCSNYLPDDCKFCNYCGMPVSYYTPESHNNIKTPQYNYDYNSMNKNNHNSNAYKPLIAVLLILVFAIIAVVIVFFKDLFMHNTSRANEIILQTYLETTVATTSTTAQSNTVVVDSNQSNLDYNIKDENEYNTDNILMNSENTNFVYSQMNEINKQYYDIFYELISNAEEDLIWNEIIEQPSKESLNYVLNGIFTDHPECFWFHDISVSWSNNEYHISYNISKDEIDDLKPKIEAAAEPILKQANSYSSDYEKALYLYKTIISMTQYYSDLQEGTPEAYRTRAIMSVLLDGQAVCAGYAKTFQYLAERCGLKCTFVTGTADGESHGWNVVWIDGEPYHIDLTYGDPVSDDGTQTINYTYFCMTTEEILKNHVISKPVGLPVCNATQANYYIKNKCYFDTYNRDNVENTLQSQIENGNKDLYLKFSSAEAFNDALEDLINGDNPQIYYILDTNSIIYQSDEQFYVITFKL